jgi:hypothetical protein
MNRIIAFFIGGLVGSGSDAAGRFPILAIVAREQYVAGKLNDPSSRNRCHTGVTAVVTIMA